MERKTCSEGPAEGAAAHGLRVLLVTGDMASHVIACSKLVLWLRDAGHEVTFALPWETAVAMAEREVKGSGVRVVQCGSSAVRQQANVHGATDAQSWRAFFDALCSPLMSLTAAMQQQLAPVHEPLLQLIKELRPDVLVHGHAVYSAAGDAAEKAGVPAVSFVHLPYDPALHLGYRAGWRFPRMVPFFPHVASYASRRTLRQSCWQWLDAVCSWCSWALASRRLQDLRRSRGLPAARADFAGYHSSQPCVVLGGPPLGPAAPVPPLAAVVGHVEREPAALDASLADFVKGGAVLVSMGTGQTLTAREAREVARWGRALAETGGPRMLWALRRSQQQQLSSVIREELGEEEEGCFLGGGLRLMDFAPQQALLASGEVKLFLSHMGFGAFAEAASCGVPLLAYPGGWDQEHNAARAIEAGMALRAPRELEGLAGVAARCLADGAMRAAAARVREHMALCGGGREAVRAVESFARMGRAGAEALRLP